MLAHELGHFAARDHLRGLGRGLTLGLLLQAIGGFGASDAVPTLASDLASRGFARDQERDADAFALDLVVAEYGHARRRRPLLRAPPRRGRGARRPRRRLVPHPPAHRRAHPRAARARRGARRRARGRDAPAASGRGGAGGDAVNEPSPAAGASERARRPASLRRLPGPERAAARARARARGPHRRRRALQAERRDAGAAARARRRAARRRAARPPAPRRARPGGRARAAPARAVDGVAADAARRRSRATPSAPARSPPRSRASCATRGFELDFAPVVDVDTNPANPVIGDRSFARTPEDVARHARAFIAALQAGGVAACAKHFPGPRRHRAGQPPRAPARSTTTSRACGSVELAAVPRRDRGGRRERDDGAPPDPRARRRAPGDAVAARARAAARGARLRRRRLQRRPRDARRRRPLRDRGPRRAVAARGRRRAPRLQRRPALGARARAPRDASARAPRRPAASRRGAEGALRARPAPDAGGPPYPEHLALASS